MTTFIQISSAIIIILIFIGFVLLLCNITQEDDPYFHCKVFKEEGCAHIDGPNCTFPDKCPILKLYEEIHKETD